MDYHMAGMILIGLAGMMILARYIGFKYGQQEGYSKGWNSGYQSGWLRGIEAERRAHEEESLETQKPTYARPDEDNH
jgi:hypothetical protein